MDTLTILIVILMSFCLILWFFTMKKLNDIQDECSNQTNHIIDIIFKTAHLIVEGEDSLSNKIEADYDALRKTLLYEMKMAQEEREVMLKKLDNLQEEFDEIKTGNTKVFTI